MLIFSLFQSQNHWEAAGEQKELEGELQDGTFTSSETAFPLPVNYATSNRPDLQSQKIKMITCKLQVP